MAFVTDTRSQGFAVGSRIAEVFAELKTRFAQYRTYRNTLAELRTLSVREMDDLGLNAETIRETALNAAYR